MTHKISAVYLQITGIAIAGIWILLLIQHAQTEGPVEFGFHLTSEFLLSVLCVAAGRLQWTGHRRGRAWAMAAHSMVIYSVLNAGGYYAQRGDSAVAALFVVLFLASLTLFLLLGFRKSYIAPTGIN